MFSDINGHGSWDHDKDEDDIGGQVQDWLADNGWAYLNTGAPTRFAHDGSPSAPDVTLAHASWIGRISWRTGSHLGSDHLPILVDIETGPVLRASRRGPATYRFKKADRGQFEERASSLFRN